jgi:galactokinase
MNRQALAQQAFEHAFGYASDRVFDAPGRVNLIGEHTDYNDGFVLPATINFGTTIAASARADKRVRVCAANFNEEVIEFSLTEAIDSVESPSWSNYVRGVTKTLLQEGHALIGADIAISGDVPYGAGLSSSAALEIVLIRCLVDLADLSIDPTKAALLGQTTENEFIGAHTGIMDQLIIARGQQDHALLIDCRSLETQAVPLDPEYRIVIFNSNVKRGLVDSEYNARRAQCQQAADALNVSHLRDATIESLDTIKGSLDPVIYRRAHHVISENERTLSAAKALEASDWTSMGQLMAQSHQSMRDDFEITVKPIDGLVEIIQQAIPAGKGGARMTGGGFGGCVVAVVHHDLVEDVIANVDKHYESQFGIKESVYICHAVDGAFMAQ